MDNFDFSPGSGAVGAAKNVGGVLYPQTISTEIDGSDTGLAAKLGSLTETAPSTDTASSGLNGRLQRIAQHITALIALLPTALGQTTKSGSLAVTIASDDDLQGKVGSLTETAPATDTASSGLNGRLQRIAQHLTSLIALLPTALGAGGGLKIDGSGTSLPVTASAGTNLNTSALALETGGNLATIAGAVSSSKMAVKAASSDFADGAIATIGAKADAKSTATDTTAITAMQVWKQISASVQAIATSIAGTITVATHAVTQSGTWNVTVNTAIAAGTNVIGHVIIDGGSTTAVTSLPAIPSGTNNIGFVTPTPSTTGGWSVSSQTALSSTKTSVKSSAGNFGGYMFYNPNSSAVYIQVFDVASGSVTVGSTTPTYVIPIPATAGANVEFTNGINHATAIVIAATTTATGSTAPSTAITGFVLYK